MTESRLSTRVLTRDHRSTDYGHLGQHIWDGRISHVCNALLGSSSLLVSSWVDFRPVGGATPSLFLFRRLREGKRKPIIRDMAVVVKLRGV